MGKIKNERLKNIYEESPGVYRIEISNGFRSDGTRDKIIEYAYGTEDNAIALRDKLFAEKKEKKAAGMNPSNDGYTLTEAAKIWLEDRNYKKRAGTTIKGYKRYLNDFILPELGYKKLRNITEEELGKLYSKMAITISKTTGKFLSGTTIKHTHAVIKAIYNYAIHRKWLLYNPAMHVDNKPKSDTAEREYYDYEEQLQALCCLDNLPTHINGFSDIMLFSQNLRFRTAISILFNTGLRKEELFGLKWKDIKENTKIFEIRRAVLAIESEYCHPDDIIEKLGNNLICKDLKNDPSRRNITVAQECFDLLKQYRENQVQNRKSATDEDYVFKQIRSEGIWSPNYLTKEWARFIVKFSLRKITVHDIRHSHATYLLSIGVPIQDVSRRLGHSDVATTLRTYTHSNLEQDKKISNIMEENFYNKASVKQPYLLDFGIIATIVTGIRFVEENILHKGLSYLTGSIIDECNCNFLIESCKTFLLENHSYLNNINLFIDKDTNKDDREAFIEMMNKLHPNICKIKPFKIEF